MGGTAGATRSGWTTRGLLAVVLGLVAALLGACGGSSGSDSSGGSGSVVTVTIKGDSVSPSGDRVEAKVGEPVTFKITADAPGELHVHSSPEQEIAFPEGTSTKQLTIDKPGLVEVEDHATDSVVVQLEVS